MNAEIKRRWVEALRSGKYKQGKARLHKGGKYCCLGVLCDIVKDEISLHQAAFMGTSQYGATEETAVLPLEVSEYAGVSSHGQLPNGNVLTRFNDSGMPFSKIANIIEEQL